MASAEASTFKPGEKPGSAGGEIKSDEDLDAAILKQVEYYFSDANFPRDKFMISETAKTPEQWINLSTVASFNRMKVLNPSLDLTIIARGIKASTELEISEDGANVRRNPSRWQKTIGGKAYGSRQELMTYARSLIAEGSAAEDGKLSAEGQAFVTDLLSHHASPAEKVGSGVTSIKVGCNPEYPDTKCFVLVRTDESEVDFSYIKCIDNVYPKETGGKDMIRRSDRKRKADESGEAPAAKKGPAAAGGTSGEAGEGASSEPNPKGCILIVKAMADDQTVQSLRTTFGDALEGTEGKVKFVEIVEDMPLAYVRFDSAASCEKALGSVEGVGELELMAGEEEEQYWEKLNDKFAAAEAKGGKGKGTG